MVLGKLDSHMEKNETGNLFYTTDKINSKLIKYLIWDYKLLEENIRDKLFGIGPMIFFLIWHLKQKEQKEQKEQ